MSGALLKAGNHKNSSACWLRIDHGPRKSKKKLAAVISKSPKDRVVGPLRNGHSGYSWLMNGGDPNHLLTEMILQVCVSFLSFSDNMTVDA